MTGQQPAEGHDKCGAQRKNEAGPCTRPAGWGTDHPGVGTCKLHLGCTPTHQRAASLEIARRECDRLGVPIVVDPGEALIRELWETMGNVAFYRELVGQLPAHPQPRSVETVEGGQDDGAKVEVPARTGIYGPTYHVSGIATGEAKQHILVALYNEERKHLAAVAAAALKAGVEERRVKLAEADAAWVLEAQVKALVAIGMGDRLDEFRRAFADALGPEPVQIEAAGAG